jgi:hypothetical protein
MTRQIQVCITFAKDDIDLEALVDRIEWDVLAEFDTHASANLVYDSAGDPNWKGEPS